MGKIQRQQSKYWLLSRLQKHACVSLWQNKTNIHYQDRSETAAVPGKQRRNQYDHFSNPAWLLSYKLDFLLHDTHAESAEFLLGKTFLASEYTSVRTQAYTYDSSHCSQTSTSNKRNRAASSLPSYKETPQYKYLNER